MATSTGAGFTGSMHAQELRWFTGPHKLRTPHFVPLPCYRRCSGRSRMRPAMATATFLTVSARACPATPLGRGPGEIAPGGPPARRTPRSPPDRAVVDREALLHRRLDRDRFDRRVAARQHGPDGGDGAGGQQLHAGVAEPHLVLSPEPMKHLAAARPCRSERRSERTEDGKTAQRHAANGDVDHRACRHERVVCGRGPNTTVSELPRRTVA